MGNGTDLWDDSALTNAFDHAMATYKAMHCKSNQANSPKEGIHTSNNNDNELVLSEKTEGHTEHANFVDTTSNNAATGTSHNNTVQDVGDPPIQENDLGASLHAPESLPYPSGFLSTNVKYDSYSDKSSMEYDQLLRHYYELEDQKQKVLQQLQQAYNWNYQTPVESSTSQAQQAVASNASEHGLSTQCCLCSCRCLAVPVMPISGCATGCLSSGYYGCCPIGMSHCSGSLADKDPAVQCPADASVCSAPILCSLDPMRHFKTGDSVVKAGILAAERAVNSTKMETSASSQVCEEKENKEEQNSGIDEGFVSRSTNSDSDLSSVLSAWYMAGFHTGRYLSDQSKRNAHQY